MYQEKWKNYFFPTKRINLPDKYTLWREFAQSLSPEARLRLEWMIFYETVGQRNASRTAEHFGISRKTFHKWHKRFKGSKERPKDLENHSRAPKKKRQWEVSFEQEERIIHLRKKGMKYGKKKLKVIYQREYKEDISTTLWWYGARRVIFTAIEDMTRIGYARAYTTISSGYAEDFLKRLMYLVEGRVEMVHSDNGSEFEGKFRLACDKLNIEQVYSRPRTPKDNPYVERFNWTVQDEWLSLSEIGLDEIPT